MLECNCNSTLYQIVIFCFKVLRLLNTSKKKKPVSFCHTVIADLKQYFGYHWIKNKNKNHVVVCIKFNNLIFYEKFAGFSQCICNSN